MLSRHNVIQKICYYQIWNVLSCLLPYDSHLSVRTVMDPSKAMTLNDRLWIGNDVSMLAAGSEITLIYLVNRILFMFSCDFCISAIGGFLWQYNTNRLLTLTKIKTQKQILWCAWYKSWMTVVYLVTQKFYLF